MNNALEFGPNTIKKVAADFEGKLFVNISMCQYKGSIGVSKHYYTVKSGIVYMINEHGEQPTGDTLLTISAECKAIGKYHPERKYKSSHKTYTVSQFCKLHKL